MAVKNSLANRQQNHPQKTGITTFLNSVNVVANIDQALGQDNRQRFITGVISAVNNNAALQECTNQSILSGALLGESLKLSPSPQLGHYYLVPFKDKNKGMVAQFQLGYKGYIQLAIRSGQYKKLNVLAIKEGELKYFDPLNEEIKINLMIDKWDEREEAKTVGYYAMFELVNGFRKAIYWSKKQMMNHADKYSPAFSAKETTVHTRYGEKKKVSFEDFEAGNFPIEDAWMYSSFWYKNFDGMAYKTMLRQLISKWGIMSVDLQNAFENDMTFTDDNGHVSYGEEDDVIDIDPQPEAPEPHEEPQAQDPAAGGQDVAAALFGR